jgi:hypothetical protein
MAVTLTPWVLQQQVGRYPSHYCAAQGVKASTEHSKSRAPSPAFLRRHYARVNAALAPELSTFKLEK